MHSSLIGNLKDPFCRNGELECLVGASKLKPLQQVKQEPITHEISLEQMVQGRRQPRSQVLSPTGRREPWERTWVDGKLWSMAQFVCIVFA